MDVKFSDFAKSNFSQFGQDGVIEKIIELCHVKSRFFVEFGSSGNDRGGGNTPSLRWMGWHGLLMDKVRRGESERQYEIHTEHITAGRIESLLEKYNVPEKFGFLSIDIDGQDYWVWKAIQRWRADIVCIESNHYLDRGACVSVPLDDDFAMRGSYYFGASQSAILALGRSKGYSLVAVCVTDMIFVSDDLLRGLNVYGLNDIGKLDTARTDSWISNPIRDELARMEWVHV